MLSTVFPGPHQRPQPRTPASLLCLLTHFLVAIPVRLPFRRGGPGARTGQQLTTKEMQHKPVCLTGRWEERCSGTSEGRHLGRGRKERKWETEHAGAAAQVTAFRSASRARNQGCRQLCGGQPAPSRGTLSALLGSQQGPEPERGSTARQTWILPRVSWAPQGVAPVRLYQSSSTGTTAPGDCRWETGPGSPAEFPARAEAGHTGTVGPGAQSCQLPQSCREPESCTFPSKKARVLPESTGENAWRPRGEGSGVTCCCHGLNPQPPASHTVPQAHQE